MRRAWNRLLTAIFFYELPCVTCGKRRVGYSMFCRKHTDEILEANKP